MVTNVIIVLVGLAVGIVVKNYVDALLIIPVALFVLLWGICYLINEGETILNRLNIKKDNSGFIPPFLIWLYIPLWFAFGLIRPEHIKMKTWYGTDALIAFVIMLALMVLLLYWEQQMDKKANEENEKHRAEQEELERQQAIAEQEKEQHIKELQEAYFQRKAERERKRALEKEEKAS